MRPGSPVVALANVLQVAPSELTGLPVPAPGNGDTDAAVVAVRQVLTAVSRDRLRSEPVPLEVLQRRVQEAREKRHQCGFGAVGEQLTTRCSDSGSTTSTARSPKLGSPTPSA